MIYESGIDMPVILSSHSVNHETSYINNIKY